jgi:uncharacterized protein YggE
MKKLIFTIAALTIIIFHGFAENDSSNPNDQNYIEVNGYAEEKITPDQIYISISIDEKDFKDRKLENIEAEMIKKLEKIGINVSENLLVKDYISNFKEYWIKKSDILMAKDYELLVNDAQTAGKVFTELEKIGISNISVARLDHSKLEELKKDVQVKAIKAAKEEALMLVKALGQSLGKAIYIREYNTSFINTQYMERKEPGIRIRGATKTGRGAETKPEVEFDKILMRYSIKVRFQLQ